MVDWKLFDGASRSDPTLCFFNASDVTRGRVIGVWTKCLRQRELDAIDPAGAIGRAIAARSASALLVGYVPPAASLSGLDRDGRRSVIAYESAADLSDVRPRSAIYYELDCAKRTLRTLKISPDVTSGIPEAAAPHGDGQRLLALMCGVNGDRRGSGRLRAERTSRPAPAARAPRTHVAVAPERPKLALARPATSNGRAAAALRPRLS